MYVSNYGLITLLDCDNKIISKINNKRLHCCWQNLLEPCLHIAYEYGEKFCTLSVF